MEKEILNNVVHSEILSIQLLKFTEIETKVSRVPGLYTWHLRPTDPTFDQIEKCYKAYQATSYNALITGEFDFKFGGPINVLDNDGVDDLRINSIDLNVLSATCLYTMPPVYIGISKGDLLRRLTDHKNAYKKFERERIIALPEISVADSDNTKESEYFGCRLAKLVKENSLSTNNLFLRVFSFKEKFNEIDREAQTKRLLQLEKMLNKTIKPVLGKR
jgi:hypothetical protein